MGDVMTAVTPPRKLRPIDRGLILIVAIGTFIGNIIPLIGVLYWQWDTFQLVILYWLETLVLAVVTLARLARLPASQRGESTVNGTLRPDTRASLVGFFALHSGCFIAAHLVFLITLFGSEWARKVGGTASYVHELLFANGAWTALTFIVVAQVIKFLVEPEPPAAAPAGGPNDKNAVVGAIVGQLYVRIVIMQCAIIFSGWISSTLNSLSPLLIIITLKTLVDLVTSLRPSTSPASPTSVKVTAGGRSRP
jgi:hypothetical protein